MKTISESIRFRIVRAVKSWWRIDVPGPLNAAAVQWILKTHKIAILKLCPEACSVTSWHRATLQNRLQQLDFLKCVFSHSQYCIQKHWHQNILDIPKVKRTYLQNVLFRVAYTYTSLDYKYWLLQLLNVELNVTTLVLLSC